MTKQMKGFQLITEFKNNISLYYHLESKSYCLSDLYRTDWIIFYGVMPSGTMGKWAHDGMFEITQEIELYINSMALRFDMAS